MKLLKVNQCKGVRSDMMDQADHPKRCWVGAAALKSELRGTEHLTDRVNM